MPSGTKPEKRKWPETDDLLAWYLFYRFDEESHPESPKVIKDWIDEFYSKAIGHWHDLMWREYQEFQEGYMPLK